MRRMQPRGLMTALEAEQMQSVQQVQQVVPEAAESLETDLLEVQDSAAEGAEQQVQVDEAVEVSEALESYKEALESIVGQGGLDRNGALMLQLGLESLYIRVGITTEQLSMPSLESFGGSSSRVKQTSLALEDIKEKAKEIWAAIIVAIKRAYEWVKGHFLKVFGSAEKLQKRAQAVKAAAENLTGKPKEAKFDNEGLFKKLHVGGDVTGFAAGFTAVTAVAKNFLNQSTEHNIKLVENFSALVENADTAAANFTVVPEQGNAMKVAPAADGFEAPSKMQILRSDEMPGGVAVIKTDVAAKLTGPEAIEAMSKMFSKIDKFNPKGKEVAKASLPTLGGSAIEAIAGQAEDIAGSLQAFRKQFDKLEAELKKFSSAVEKLSDSADKEEDVEKKKVLNSVSKGAAAVPRMLTSGPSAFSGYALSVAKAALDYCELSIKQYEAK